VRESILTGYLSHLVAVHFVVSHVSIKPSGPAPV